MVVFQSMSRGLGRRVRLARLTAPVTAARVEAIGARGGSPFGEYQIPLAILTLKQGLGRLLRHRQDRGVLAVLDPRLKTMGYGRRFLASLPPAVAEWCARVEEQPGFIPGPDPYPASARAG